MGELLTGSLITTLPRDSGTGETLAPSEGVRCRAGAHPRTDDT